MLGEELSKYLLLAWLLPLIGFAVEVLGGYWGNRQDKRAAYIAIACIGSGFLLSSFTFYRWGTETDWQVFSSGGEAHVAAGEHAGGPDHGEPDHEGEKHESDVHADHSDDEAGHADESHAQHSTAAHHQHAESYSGTFYTLATFGSLTLSVDYYIDSLTILMFCMVTLIATCIHIYAVGYMSDELVDEYVDHFAHTSDGKHVHRPGRFHRFFSFLSLFCFSMLGIVLAGNIFQVFVFWELVGISSYLLIGFYTERKSANVAANKAFIVNRVGDLGFIIGLMILWTYCGTFSFGDYELDGTQNAGLFSMVRGSDGVIETSGDNVLLKTADHHGSWEVPDEDSENNKTLPYSLLVIAGLGIFGGCIGKSAQFPLQTWLPDAMEGPTPVSALVHSATMVAAGVYLAARFYPMFTVEVLLTIAYIGCITLFMAATIAVVATDIKRVLAYSTISQLGYMMLAIGLGGWAAGLFHLITHAFFKSLMFLCSGSVIHGCHHEQEMTKMGGLRHKMPITAYTMLIGVIAISGLAIPGTSYFFGQTLAFSGFHSKDAIVATALAHTSLNPLHFLLFLTPLVTAGITAFYMFRLWFYTFTGKPRDQHVYDNCHESPKVMCLPLVILAVFAAGCALGGEQGVLYQMIGNSEPIGVAGGVAAGTGAVADVALPSHHEIHEVHGTAGVVALLAAAIGTIVAFLLYCRPVVDPASIKKQFSGVHGFLVEKWQFDNLYDAAFVRPAHVIGRWCAGFDRNVLDGILHTAARTAIWIGTIDKKFDETVVDGLVNAVGNTTRSVGYSLSVFQTGRIRQYVMFIAISVVALFALLFAFMPKA